MPRIGSVPSLTRVLFPLALCLGSLTGCCVTPPTAEELLDLGYRSPAQAFHTLRAAIRGDLPRLEYRSLSADFRRRNGLSQLSYREFREDWHAENPWMIAALSSAEIIESELDPGGRRAILRVGVLGQEALIVLVAEDFVQLWDFDELREDIAVDDMGTYLKREAGSWSARVPGGDPAPTELRIGREWKIDRISEVEALDI